MHVVQLATKKSISWSPDIDLPREAQEQARKFAIHFNESIRDGNRSLKNPSSENANRDPDKCR